MESVWIRARTDHVLKRNRGAPLAVDYKDVIGSLVGKYGRGVEICYVFGQPNCLLSPRRKYEHIGLKAFLFSVDVSVLRRFMEQYLRNEKN